MGQEQVKLLNMDEAARHLGIARDTLYRRVKAGSIMPPYLCGSTAYFTIESIENLKHGQDKPEQPVELFSLKDVAARIHISDDALRRYIIKGMLVPTYRRNKTPFFTAAELPQVRSLIVKARLGALSEP